MLMEALLSTVSIAALKTALIFMPVMMDAGTAQYQIQRSVRFRASANGNFTHAAWSSAGNRQLMTFSFWIKRSRTATADERLFDASDVFNNMILFNTSLGGIGDQIGLLYGTTGGGNYVFTQMLFRDPAAWYHVVFSFDTTQATAANRVRIFVNGVQQTGLGGTQPAQNFNLDFGHSTSKHVIGNGPVNGVPYDGYMADIHYINGQALTPSDFAETDTTTGAWVPKAYAGTYGTNGYHLDFSDPSAATAAALGKDSSGNGNNFTPNSISVTAGTTYDSMVDSPTNYGADAGTGGEVRGNYATLNPVYVGGPALSYAAMRMTGTAATSTEAISTIALPTTGKWYFEAAITTVGSENYIAIKNVGLPAGSIIANTANYYGFYGLATNSLKISNGTNAAYGSNWTTAGQVMGVAYDADNNKIYFRQGGTWLGSADPVAGTNPAYTTAAGEYVAAFGGRTSPATVWDVNFGQRAFANAAPSGFKALCTQNIAEPAIVKSSQYFNARVYTGNHAANAITGVGHSPDLVWLKNRPNAFNTIAYDTLRTIGTGNQYLLPDSFNAEQTADTNTKFTSFDSDGFTLAGSSSTDMANNNGTANNQISWNWKKGVTPGFDIVLFTNTATSAGINHGLGVKPDMVWVKIRSVASTPWGIQHRSMSANMQDSSIGFTTAAATVSAGIWGAEPTATQFFYGSGMSSTGGRTCVAYLFTSVPGFSYIGKYTGNGAADGPWVWCGFRPRFVMMKRYDAGTEDWFMYDAARDPVNPATLYLRPNTAAAEGNVVSLDLLSNGFKLRIASSSPNTSAGTYIFAAFAEAPFKYARAR